MVSTYLLCFFFFVAGGQFDGRELNLSALRLALLHFVSWLMAFYFLAIVLALPGRRRVFRMHGE